MEPMVDNIAAIKQRILQACLKSGRSPDSIKILAVSKGQPVEALLEAKALGLLEFGENYPQELKAKKTALGPWPDTGFIFIGRIQSNKIPMIVQNAREIQSLASLEHAAILARTVEKLSLDPYPVWLLVNSGGEATKDGFRPDAVPEAAQQVTNLYPNLRLRGIMAIPPPLSDPEQATFAPPASYQRLRVLADSIGEGLLSLGMSDDLEQAILAGSNCVRIGTALFGTRLPKKPQG